MHNTFSAEYGRRGLTGLRALKALANPTRAMRLGKERILAAGRAPRTFVAVADAALDEVEGLVRGRHPVVAIPNAIDTERYRVAGDAERHAARQRLDLADGRLAVAFVGHEFERKGLLELIGAMALLPEQAVLLVAGGASQDVPRFRAACADAGVTDRVRFLGEVDDVPSLFAATDVFCIPSRYETVPMVALEALACGVPTVVSDRCPAQRFLDPAVNGAVCTVDPASIAEAVRTASRLPRGDAVRRAVEGESWAAAAARYVEVLAAT
jgi:UDP-glucose:(heptosyl)LPS alpha-1,3-glucosyltransferase